MKNRWLYDVKKIPGEQGKEVMWGVSKLVYPTDVETFPTKREAESFCAILNKFLLQNVVSPNIVIDYAIGYFFYSKDREHIEREYEPFDNPSELYNYLRRRKLTI